MLELFNFKGKDIRFVNGKPVANDVAEVLGYADASATVSKKVKPKYKSVAKMETVDGKLRDVMVLEEAGIYQLIVGSKLESADEFQDWLFEEVLPSIRKTGSYSINQPVLPTTYLEALKCLVVAEEEKLKIQSQLEHEKFLSAVKDETIGLQKNTIEEWHPLVINYKQFLDGTGLITMSQAAKMLAGEKSGRNRLIAVLRLYGFLYSDRNEPLQKWMKYFSVKMKTRKHPNRNGVYDSDPATLFTPEGLNKVVKIMEAKAGSRELLLEYLNKPEKLVAVLTQEKEGKRNNAITAIENALPEDEMSIKDHMEESLKLGFYKPSND